MKRRACLVALVFCLWMAIGALAEPTVDIFDRVYKLGDTVRIEWSGEAPETADARVYHLDGTVDAYTFTLRQPGSNRGTVELLPASGDWMRINAFDDEGMAWTDTCTLAGLPQRAPFKLQFEASTLVAKPEDTVTLTLSPTGGMQPYQGFTVSIHTLDAMGYRLQQLTAFEGQGPFALNLAELAVGDAKTCLIEAQGTDSAGQRVMETLYLQLSAQDIAPLSVTAVLEDGPVVRFPATLTADIQGGVPPYQFSTLWLVESAQDGISMPGEWEDAQQSSTLFSIEPGRGLALASVIDSAGHYVQAAVPFLAAAHGTQPDHIRGVVQARQQGTLTESMVGSSPEHRELMGRWVIETPDWEGEALFLYDGTAYVYVFQNDMARMNLMERMGGIATVRDGRIEIADWEGQVRELRYERHGQTLKLFFSDYESAEYVLDPTFVNAPQQ